MNLDENQKFEALKMQFENQAELLYRMTLIDLRIFSGFITLQLALGAWLATKGQALLEFPTQIGLLAIDLSLAVVAAAMLYNSLQRRKEVAATIGNCARALGYKKPGEYLDNEPLDADFVFRPWAGWYYLGIVTSIVGVISILFSYDSFVEENRVVR